MANGLDLTISNWTAYDVIKTMLIYNRQELTENTEAEQNKLRPIKKGKRLPVEFDLDAEIEKEAILFR